MDHWAQPRHMEISKTWWKPMTRVHFNPKRTQGVAPRPRPVRVLLPLCCWDFRSVVWRKGVSPKTLVTIKQLSLSLLGDMVASLWELKSIEHAWPNPSPKKKPANQAFNAFEKTISKAEEAWSWNEGETILIFIYGIFSNSPLQNTPLMVKFGSPLA